MNIVRIMGGLGNQMYQYAFAQALRKHANDMVLFDVSSFETTPVSENDVTHFSLELSRFPNIYLPVASKFAIKRYRCLGQSLLDKTTRVLFSSSKHYCVESNPRVCNDILSLQKTYFEGFWQSATYFSDLRQELLCAFTLPMLATIDNMAAIEKMLSTESVSIHIRRGDYLKFAEIYGGICTREYYDKAISFVRERTKAPHFFVFSDDPVWTKEQFSGKEFTTVDWNKGQDSLYDMQLMKYCKHNIIANSSFSFWGAWLNECENKIVISPATMQKGKPVSADEKIQEWIYL